MKKFLFLLLSLVCFEAKAIVNMDMLLSSSTFKLGVGDSSNSKIMWGVETYYNLEDDFGALVSIGSSFVDDQQSPWVFAASVMGHAVHIDHSNDDVNFALSFGGTIGYKFLTKTPTALFFEGQYAPSVVVSGSLNRLWMINTSYQIMMSEASILSFGYINYTAHFENPQLVNGESRNSYNIFNNLYVGLKFRF